MRDLIVLFVHLLATVARLAGPGGARSGVAESLLVKQQVLILSRSRKRSPNLRLSDRIPMKWLGEQRSLVAVTAGVDAGLSIARLDRPYSSDAVGWEDGGCARWRRRTMATRLREITGLG